MCTEMNKKLIFTESLHTNILLVLQIYWAGPIFGGVVAALLYTQAFNAPEIENDRSDKYRTDASEKEVRQRTLVL